MPETITVLGAGAWGLTMADLLAGNGHVVTVWDRSPEAIEQLQRTSARSTFPGDRMHGNIRYEHTLSTALQDRDVVVGAVPSFGLRGILPAVVAAEGHVFINCSKGIEGETLMLPNAIFADMVGSAGIAYAVLAGPSHAEEVCRNVPTAVVAASADGHIATWVQDIFSRPTFRVYSSSDCIGVELGGALKNVIAIAAGACDGLGFGDNTKAALLTRGVAEIARAARALNADPGTVRGLSGVGDLIVTAMSKHSRNRKFGELVASGLPPQAALEKVGAVVEGYLTSRSAYQLSQKTGTDMPIITAIYRCLYEGTSPQQAVLELMTRELAAEIPPTDSA